MILFISTKNDFIINVLHAALYLIYNVHKKSKNCTQTLCRYLSRCT